MAQCSSAREVPRVPWPASLGFSPHPRSWPRFYGIPLEVACARKGGWSELSFIQLRREGGGRTGGRQPIIPEDRSPTCAGCSRCRSGAASASGSGALSSSKNAREVSVHVRLARPPGPSSHTGSHVGMPRRPQVAGGRVNGGEERRES